MNSIHQSFRLTKAPYLDGMRVKPRLRFVHYAILTLRLILVFGSIGAFWSIVIHVLNLPPADNLFRLVCGIGHLFIVFLVNDIGFLTGRAIAIRFGWLSYLEACSYRRVMYRWPDCWLEPHPGVEQRHPLDLAADEPRSTSRHSVGRILESRSRGR